MNVSGPLQEMMKESLLEMTSWDTSFHSNMDMNQPPCPTFPTLSFNEPSFEDLNFLDDAASVDNMLSAMGPPTPAPTAAIEDPMPIVLRSPKAEMPSLLRIQLLRATSELTEKRLRYGIEAFKRAPEKMMLEGGTPWSHPAIYRDSMPEFLEGRRVYVLMTHSKRSHGNLCYFTHSNLDYHRRASR
jgi:hypothetical protein